VDIDIAFIGVRPGEKLYEELSSEQEHIGDTAHPKIGIWKHRVEDARSVREKIERLLSIADTASNGRLQAELQRLVPEYTPDANDDPRPPAAPVRPTAPTEASKVSLG